MQEHCHTKLLATRYSPVAAIFGFNWRVVLPHDQKLDEFGCSGEQPSSFVPARPKFFRHGRSRALQKNHSLLATRRSPFAIVLALTGGSCSSTTEIFSARQSRALQKNHSLLATRRSPFAIVLALTGGSCSSTTEIFSARQSRALQKNHSPLAIRYSLPFRLGRSLAFPIHSVPRPPSHAPF
jgi:hypothetical protein